MSEFELPEQVKPYPLTAHKAVIKGVIGESRLTRLAATVTAVKRPAAAQLTFSVDDSGYRLIQAEVDSLVQVQCQRCLQDFDYHLQGSFQLALVHNETMAKGLPDHLEPLLLLPDEPLDVIELVEDELLLSLPIQLTHEPEDCQVKLQFGDDEAATEPTPVASPFDILAKMK